ncbi:hypothetical protein WJX84_009795, partial [Apatococcus fuscideae]
MAPINTRQGSPQVATATDKSQKQKDRALNALSKLGDRDTQKNAIADLTAMTREADAESVGTLVSCICSGGTERKVSARKESVRLLSELCTPACPAHQTVLQRPLIGKVITFLKARFKDTDSSVREATATAFGLIAANLEASQSSFCTGDTSSNPVLRAIFESLGAQQKEVDLAASQALSKVVDSTPPITPALWKQLLRWLNTPFFEGNQYIIAAIANLGPEGAMPCGLILGGHDIVSQFLPSIVGCTGTSSSGGSGLAVALASSDWQTRRAAAEALQALAIAFGPALDTEAPKSLGKSDEMAKPSSLRASAALNGNCRYDKVRMVRTAATEASAAYTYVQEFRQSGKDAGEWPGFCAARIMAGKENAAQSPGIAREKLRTSSSGTVSSPAPAALSTAGSDGPSAAALGRQGSSRYPPAAQNSPAMLTPESMRPAWSSHTTRGEPTRRGSAHLIAPVDIVETASAGSDRETVPSSIFAASRKLQGPDAHPVPEAQMVSTTDGHGLVSMQQPIPQANGSPGAPLYGGESPIPAEHRDGTPQTGNGVTPHQTQSPHLAGLVHTHPSLAPFTPLPPVVNEGRVAHLERTIEDMQAGMDVMQRRMGDLEALVQQLQQQLPA